MKESAPGCKACQKYRHNLLKDTTTYGVKCIIGRSKTKGSSSTRLTENKVAFTILHYNKHVYLTPKHAHYIS